MPLSSKIVKILGPAGILTRNWQGFESRDDQIDLAEAIGLAIENGSRIVAEAGTGTGKTLSYLVPVFVSGQKAIISTATKNLQEQIVLKDIPNLASFLGFDVEPCLVKGRMNYLCLRKFEKSRAENRIDPYLAQILDVWANASETGDIAEADFIKENDPLWKKLTSSSDQCHSGECAFFDRCFITRLRRRASAASLVVVNHHLMMADLALKKTGHGQVLPDSDIVVFDEAHELEEAATDHFSQSVSDLRINNLADDISEEAPIGFAGLIETLKRAAGDLFGHLELKGDKYALDENTIDQNILEKGKNLIAILNESADELEEAAGAEGANLARRAIELADGLMMILKRSEPEYVYFGEKMMKGFNLKAAPVEVGGILSKYLFSQPRSFVFLSATLDPPLFRERLNLNKNTDEYIFPSPFDFKRNSVLYIPAKIAPPMSPQFADQCAEEMYQLIKLTHGKAFLLFTSFRNLEAVYRRLSPRLSYHHLKQGQAPKAKLISEFLNHDDSVLFATASFWQGVDIPGPALSLVAIDKLPFAPPNDPLVAARIERIQSLGVNPFIYFQVPEATIGLRQGLGRLIRNSTDKGILAIMDTRLINKGYGRQIIKKLPPSPIIRDISQLADWAEKNLYED